MTMPEEFHVDKCWIEFKIICRTYSVHTTIIMVDRDQ